MLLNAQGFGSFTFDQPYLAKDATAATPTLPTAPGLNHDWKASSVDDGSVTDWIDSIQGFHWWPPAGREPVKQYGGVYFNNPADQSAHTALNTTNLSFTTDSNVEQVWLIVTSNAVPNETGANNLGNFLGHGNQATGFQLLSSGGAVTWQITSSDMSVDTVANFGASMPQGIQAVLLMQSPFNAVWTNGVLSITNITIGTIGTGDMKWVGRPSIWNNSSSFTGYIMEVVTWTNITAFNDSLIQQAFNYVTATYGDYGP